MITDEVAADGLAGELIRDIFGAAETIADLHACLTPNPPKEGVGLAS